MLGFLRDLVVIVVVAVLASFLIKSFLVRSFYIPSASMENTLQVNDRILVNELVPNLVPLHRGDVIVFKDPDGWLTGDVVPPPQSFFDSTIDWFASLVGASAQDANDHLVKRVIGLPGDQVTCCDARDRLEINGVPVREPFKTGPNVGSDRPDDIFTVVVPKGDLWVEGDNRQNSSDSRFHRAGGTHGFVPIKDVVGRAFVISWPIGRWTFLSNYPDSFIAVDPKS